MGTTAALLTQVNGFPVHERLEAALAVLGKTGTRLLDAAERHRRFFVSGVHVDVSEAGLDAIDIFPRGAEIGGVDR
jgi:hypothetical protein